MDILCKDTIPPRAVRPYVVHMPPERPGVRTPKHAGTFATDPSKMAVMTITVLHETQTQQVLEEPLEHKKVPESAWR